MTSSGTNKAPNLRFREAERGDLAELIAMLANDALGAKREDTAEPLNERYADAFDEIRRDPNSGSRPLIRQ